MTRPNIDVSLPGACKFTHYDGSLAQNAQGTSRRTIETTSGTGTRRKPSGWLPPSAYSFSRKYVSYAYGTCVFYASSAPQTGQRYTGGVGQGNGGRFFSENHFDACVLEATALDTGSLSNQALIKARLKLKGQSLNLGVAWAERQRTAQLVGDTTIQLARAFTAVRTGKVRHAMNLLGISSRRKEPRGSNVPRKWLELQYGWKPLVSDVYGACEALSKRDRMSDWRVTAIGEVHRELTWTNTIPPYISGPSLNPDASYCDAKSWQGAYVRIDAIPGNTALSVLSSLGVTNPLEVAWELVPYSFVVDWFLPVGDWVRTLDAMLGYASATTSTSVLARAFWLEKGLSGKHPSNGRWVDNSFTGSKERVKLTRSVTANVPLPVPPSFKDGASLGHMANGLALLASAFGRR